MNPINNDDALSETLDFFSFSYLKNSDYRGGVRFVITYPDGSVSKPVVIVSDEGVFVSHDGNGVNEEQITCTAECSRETFFQIYWNKLSSTRAVMSGLVKLPGLRLREISKFVGSFDTSTASWDRFYKARGIIMPEAEPVPDLLPVVWNALASFGSLLVSPLLRVASAASSDEPGTGKLYPDLYTLPKDMFSVQTRSSMWQPAQQPFQGHVLTLQPKNRILLSCRLLLQSQQRPTDEFYSQAGSLMSRSMLHNKSNDVSSAVQQQYKNGVKIVKVRTVLSDFITSWRDTRPDMKWASKVFQGSTVTALHEAEGLEAAYLQLFTCAKSRASRWMQDKMHITQYDPQESLLTLLH